MDSLLADEIGTKSFDLELVLHKWNKLDLELKPASRMALSDDIIQKGRFLFFVAW